MSDTIMNTVNLKTSDTPILDAEYISSSTETSAMTGISCNGAETTIGVVGTDVIFDGLRLNAATIC